MQFGSNHILENLEANKSKFDLELLFQKFNRHYLVNARAGLSLVLKALKEYDEIYIPNFLCEDVYQTILKSNKKINTYILDSIFEYSIGLEEIRNRKFIVYVSNYYGLSNENKLFEVINKLRSNNTVYVIYDITHNLYSCIPNKEVDTYISSLRKWLAMPDGAFLATNLKVKTIDKVMSEQNIDNFIKASYLKGLYINCSKINFDSNYYRNIFEKCEKAICEIFEPYVMSLESKTIFENYNHCKMKQRLKNYNFLVKNIKNDHLDLIFNKKQRNIVPFVCPIKSRRRDELRKYLMQNEVYCAIHWMQDYLKDSQTYNNLGEEIISIPIDQRYKIKDMKHLVKILNNFGVKDV